MWDKKGFLDDAFDFWFTVFTAFFILLIMSIWMLGAGDNSIELLNWAATSCVESNYLGCTSIEDHAYKVQTLNEKLYEYNCVTIY